MTTPHNTSFGRIRHQSNLLGPNNRSLYDTQTVNKRNVLRIHTLTHTLLH